MANDEFMNKRRALAKHFENVCQRLLSGDSLNLYEEDVSSMFEVIATQLLSEASGREFNWYDGVIGLNASVTKLGQIEFTGQMWVGDNRTQWKEDFRAIVIDKQVAKQGIGITLCIGSDRAEGDLLTAFGITKWAWPVNILPGNESSR